MRFTIFLIMVLIFASGAQAQKQTRVASDKGITMVLYGDLSVETTGLSKNEVYRSEARDDDGKIVARERLLLLPSSHWTLLTQKHFRERYWGLAQKNASRILRDLTAPQVRTTILNNADIFSAELLNLNVITLGGWTCELLVFETTGSEWSTGFATVTRCPDGAMELWFLASGDMAHASSLDPDESGRLATQTFESLSTENATWDGSNTR